MSRAALRAPGSLRMGLLRTGLLLMVLPLVPACGEPAPSPHARPELAALQGEWRISLTADQRRQLRVMEYVLRSPTPTDEEVLAADFSGDDARTAVALLQEVRAAPTGPRVAELRAAVAQLADAELAFDGDRLRLRLGAVAHEGEWRLLEAVGDRLRLQTRDAEGREQELVLELRGDTLTFGEGADAMRFVRR